ncbi:MAG: 5' nucleotidase, NT5C type [Desulfocucumaceae bacterium]
MKRVGIDIDGVIADSQPLIIQKLNDCFGRSFSLEDFVDFKPEKMFGIDRRQLDDFIMERELEIIEEAVPLPGAVRTVKELIQTYKIYIVSARTPIYLSHTESWLKRFEIPYHDIKLLGQHDKRAACTGLCVDIFIEDSLKNATQVSSCGIPVLLMDATYNRSKLPDMVTRVYNWEEIKEYLGKNL